MDWPRSHGMSNDDIKRRIYNKASPFICGVDPYLLIQPLIKENVITTEEWQQIEKENDTNRRKCWKLYNYLKCSSHPRAFLVVKESLVKHRHPFLNDLENGPTTSNDCVNEHSASNNQVQQTIKSSLEERVEKLEKERDEALRQFTDLKQRFEILEALVQPGTGKRRNDESKAVTKKQKRKVTVRAIGRISVPDQDIRGVAKLDGSIYILCKDERRPTDSEGYSHAIRVYEDQDEFRFLKEIPLNGIKDGYNLVSCDKSKCLYFYDLNEQCIWIVTPGANDNQVEKWFSYESEFVRLSVGLSKNGHLLVKHPDDFVEIYDGSTRALVHRFQFPEDIEYPEYVYEKENGQFIIFHRSSDCEGPFIISQMNSDGTVTARYKQHKSPKLSVAECYFCFDSLNDRIFVTDWWRNQVHMIDGESFQFVKTLLKSKDMDNDMPLYPCYDEEKHQLFVCFDSETAVRIFYIF